MITRPLPRPSILSSIFSMRSRGSSSKAEESVEEDDRKQARFRGDTISSGRKKSRGSNSGDGGNTRDEGKMGSRVIGAYGSGISSEEVFPGEAGENECPSGKGTPRLLTADLGSCVNLIPLYLFKKLKIGLLEETDHVFGLADGTKSYPVGIVKNVEVHIERLKLFNDFYVIEMDKDPATPLLVGRGFLATANVVIDYRNSKIAVEEGVILTIFGVKEINLGEKEVPYWTTLGKWEAYTPRPNTDGIDVRPSYYAKKDFVDYHFPGE
ncbi:MAK10-like protein [Tanacetum coccineum]